MQIKAMCTKCHSPQIVDLEPGDDLGEFSCAKCGERLKRISEDECDDYYKSGEAERRRTTGILRAKKEPKEKNDK